MIYNKITAVLFRLGHLFFLFVFVLKIDNFVLRRTVVKNKNIVSFDEHFLSLL